MANLFFDPTELPGALAQPDYFKYEGTLALNYREPRGNPRRGGRYGLSYQRFEDTAGGRFSFDRFEVDLQQYIPLLRDRRVLALHGFTSISDADGGAEVPFYLQRTLGGPDDLRGFRHLRFRDRNVLLTLNDYAGKPISAHELIGYNPMTKAFSSHVYSNVAPDPWPYEWDMQGDRWTISIKYGPMDAEFNGELSADGNSFSGGWRPRPGADEKINSAYDVRGTRIA